MQDSLADNSLIPTPPPLPRIADDEVDIGDKAYGTVYNLGIPPPPAEITSAPEPKSDTLRQALTPSSGVDNNVYDPMQFSAPPVIQGQNVSNTNLITPYCETDDEEYENVPE